MPDTNAPATAKTLQRVIKKYPNRRLYDTDTSTYITLAEVKQLVMAHQSLVVRDAKTGEDITRSIFLQILLEEEAGGAPMFTEAVLANIIRFYGHTMQGFMGVADVIKEDSPQAVRELQGMGIRVVMLTGDNERTAKAIGEQAGVDEGIAGVLPDGKEAVIRSLKNKGRVAMVGDGINDAPALTRADVGIAIGAGTDVAIDAADVVLMKSRLSDVPAAIRLSRATLHNIHENLFWAFAYNVLGIPLAAGVFIPLLHWQMNPMYGAAAMSLYSFCVVSNALRLNLFDIRSTKHDHKRKAHKTSKKENTTMHTTIKSECMMCGHC